MQGLWQITVMTDDAPVALEAGIETRLDISTISISKKPGALYASGMVGRNA